MKLTDEQRRAMGLEPTTQSFIRGWTPKQIKDEIKKKGFTLSEFERECGFYHNSISQALKKRYPKIDKAIAVFLDVHESVIWPNRYFANGVAINSSYDIETRTDEELRKLNAEFLKPVEITIIHDWVGTGGQPTISTFIPPEPNLVADDAPARDPFYDQPIYEDVSPTAGRQAVSLPVGMKIL